MKTGLSQLEILLLTLSIGVGLAAVLVLNLWAMKKFRRWTFTRVGHFIAKPK